jgi:hypothetical protein
MGPTSSARSTLSPSVALLRAESDAGVRGTAPRLSTRSATRLTIRSTAPSSAALSPSPDRSSGSRLEGPAPALLAARAACSLPTALAARHEIAENVFCLLPLRGELPLCCLRPRPVI